MRAGGVIVVMCATLSASGVLAQSPVSLAVEPFPLGDVRLLEGPFQAAQELDRKYLHDLDPDRLLHTFRLNAGLPSAAEPLGGWEEPNCELRGHSMGHYLSACALMYAATGDAELKDRATTLVAELAKCQAALGESGYLSAFPETWFDRAEARQPVWAPYYTLHKIYIGLMDVYQYCGDAQALAVVEKLAAWNQGRLGRLDDAAMQAMLDSTEQGGMNEAFTRLYSLTGNETYLETAARFNQRTYVEPLLEGRDTMKGQHVNSFIPNIIGNAVQYEATGDRSHRHIAEYFWRQVVDHRSYATGGVSNHEHFRTGPDELAEELGDHTQETCCTYNMLKLAKHLFTWGPQARYGDYYERALVNSILSTQHPRTGMMMYFVPLATGRHKTFNLPNGSFWCCTGTGMENHARYGEAVYFHQGDRLYVNLFMATELDWQTKGVTLRQETAFPNADTSTLTIKADQPTRIDLRVRVPYWAVQGVSLRLNGEDLAAEPGADRFLAIDRTWQDGDTLAIHIPMSLHRHAMPDDPDLVAFLYGPLVLAGKLDGEGLTDENTHTGQNWYKFEGELPTVPPMQVTSDNIHDWLQPVPGKPMTFQTTRLETPIELVPYHQLFNQRYCVYWRLGR